MNRRKIGAVCGTALLIVAAIGVAALRNRRQPVPPPEVPVAQTPAEVRVKAVERKSATVARANAATASRVLTNTVYSDGTSTVSMAYDRVGNLVSAITAGVCTNLYAYDTTGLCTNEVQNGVAIARSYDALGRPTGYILRDSARGNNCRL